MKFQLPSFIFVVDIPTCVILREMRFVKNSQNLSDLVKIAQIFALLPIDSANFTNSHWSPPFKNKASRVKK